MTKFYNIIGGDQIGTDIYTQQYIQNSAGELIVDLDGLAIPASRIIDRAEEYPALMAELIELRNYKRRILLCLQE